jgi:hypothetical protein
MSRATGSPDLVCSTWQGVETLAGNTEYAEVHNWLSVLECLKVNDRNRKEQSEFCDVALEWLGELGVAL